MRNHVLFVLLFVTLHAVVLAQPAEKWATFDGNKIRYYDVGDAKAKRALVFIHGWTCNADFWKESLNAFPQYRVIALDLPGHGKSDKPEVNYTMEYFARGVDAVLRQAKVNRAVLVGHSMGTPVARQFYKLFPERTLAIVVVDMPLLPFGAEEDMNKFADSVIGNYPESAAQFVDGMLSLVKDPDKRSFIRRSMLAAPKHVAVSAMTQIFVPSVWAKDAINVPVLAIIAKTPMWNPTRDDFVQIAPKAEFQLWTDVSHFLMMEQPMLFNGQVKGFIIRNKLL